MLNQASITHYGSLLAKVEAEEPLISLWRTQVPRGRKLRMRDRIRGGLGNLRRHAFSLRALGTPSDGQVVFYAASATTSTLGAILPLMQELCGLSTPPLFLTNPRTQTPVGDFGQMLQVDIRIWLARLSSIARERCRRRARYLAEILRKTFEEEYDEGILSALEIAALMEEATAEYLVGAGALVMETDYFPLSKGLALGAKRAGVPVFFVQHGLFGPHQFPMYCDRLLCWGDYFKERAGLFGMADTVPVVGGCPRWDPLETSRHAPKNLDIRRTLGGSSDRPLVLLLSNAHGKASYPDVYDRYFRAVRRLLDAGMVVALKPHPAEKGLAHYRGEIPPELLDRIVVAPKEISLWDVVRHSDVIYHVFSTAALEAMILGVPVLFTAPAQGQQLTEIPESGGGMWCPYDQVVDYCTALGSEGSARVRLLESQGRFLDAAVAYRGNATEKCVGIIQETAKVW
jgi:hypothetical protein